MPDYSIETDPLRLVVRAGNTEWEITAPNGKMVVREYYPGDRMVEHRTTDIPLPRAALVEFARAVLAGEDASGPWGAGDPTFGDPAQPMARPSYGAAEQHYRYQADPIAGASGVTLDEMRARLSSERQKEVAQRTDELLAGIVRCTPQAVIEAAMSVHPWAAVRLEPDPEKPWGAKLLLYAGGSEIPEDAIADVSDAIKPHLPVGCHITIAAFGDGTAAKGEMLVKHT